MIVTAVNASPRPNRNTAQLVKAAAEGAKNAGCEVRYFDLYRQPKFTGCISCFGCKRQPNEGVCVCRDGLAPILDSIRESDGFIVGAPNYLGLPSSGFLALYERLVFQNLTYQREKRSYRAPATQTLFILTSNMPEEGYQEGPYARMIDGYRNTLSSFVGPTRVMIAGDTLQVDDYSKYNWTLFDPAHKQARHESVFPRELRYAAELGGRLCGSNR